MLLLSLVLSSLFAVEVLDIEMDSFERKKTGISKLGEKEKAELQAWIDNNYEKRGEPLLAKTTFKEQRSTLQENLNSGSYIRLSDGSLWNIRPSDTPISQSWITPIDLIVTQSGDQQYPFKLTNSITGSTVYARKATSVPQAPPYTPNVPTTGTMTPDLMPPATGPTKK